MSREALQESLSAVMDNEADEMELRRVLSASDDAELRAKWSRYQMARAVMHKELLEPRLDIAAAVSAAIADDDTPKVAASVTRGPWRAVGRLAVAASVTVAVLAGVRLYNQDELTGSELAQQAASQPAINHVQVQGPAMLAGFTTDSQGPSITPLNKAEPTWHEQRLPSYVRQHAQQAEANVTEGALPYARAASLESR